MAHGQPPSTDFGTVLLHWMLVLTFFILVLTGLKIASDEPGLTWLCNFEAVLPTDHVWYWHLIAAVPFMATLGAYIVYIRQARLTQRIRFDASRASGLRRPGKARRNTLGVLAIWGLLISLFTEVITGCMLMAGVGGATLSLHLAATGGCLTLAMSHIAAHWALGGAPQVMRILRPSRLVVGAPPPDFVALLAEQIARHHQPPTSQPQPTDSARDSLAARLAASRSPSLHAHPLATALAAGVGIAMLGVWVENATRTTLVIREITNAQAPVIDGDLSDPVWSQAPVVSVLTQHGGTFGGSGQSIVEIRAVHDATYAYFAFVWADPTRSLKYRPLVKAVTGWQLAPVADPDGSLIPPQDDKFAVLLTSSTLALIGGAIRLASQPVDDAPAGRSGRGLHFTRDGSQADVWVWRASHSGVEGHVDACHIGPLKQPQPQHLKGQDPYTGGLTCDTASKAYADNIVWPDRQGTPTKLHPLRLPREPPSPIQAAAYTPPATAIAEHGDGEAQRWWAQLQDTVPYSVAADAKLPVGTMVPGVIMLEPPGGDPSPIRGVARWSAGRWVLEVVRALSTGEAGDVSIKSGVLMWVAAFDHNETRHSYHLRPIRLEVE